MFEGKVASFWCVLQYTTPFKINSWYERDFLFMLSNSLTLLFSAPSLLMLFLAPSKRQFLFSLYSVSQVFFFLGFQVHEK